MCTECGAGNGYLTLSPASEIHACHREQSRVGLLDHATIIWEGARRAWLDNRLECHAECPSCALRYLCGGGCRYDAMLGSGDVRRPNARNCELQKVRLLMALRVLDELGEPLAAKAAGIDLSRRAQLRPVVKCNKSPTEA
jgi:radical SAM protein with 4Fe4S-binding SPASM domain